MCGVRYRHYAPTWGSSAVYRAVRSVIDSRVCRAEHYFNSYVSVRKYKQMKIATELHRPTWVSLPLVDAILRDDVLISFITPPELQTGPI